MVGAYQLEGSEYDLAIKSFEEGINFARKADAQADEMLNQGYIFLAKLLASPGDNAVRTGYDSLKADFQDIEYGGASSSSWKLR